MTQVNLASVMKRYLHMSERAVDCAFGHGQVTLDGRMLGSSERVFDYDAVRGQMLVAAGREIRLGSRPAPPPQGSLFG